MSGRTKRRRTQMGRGVNWELDKLTAGLFLLQNQPLSNVARDINNKMRSKQRGGKLDVQKALAKTGIEFHWPGYQYMGPGTHLEKRLKHGDPGKNRLDRISKTHDIDYSRATSLKDKHKADGKMIASIDKLPGKKTKTERVVKTIMKAKVKLGV